jgi:hypothetical protein
MAINWTRLVAGAVRRADPNHLVCVGTDQEDLRRGPFRPDNIYEEVDFFSSHQYPIYMLRLFPDPMLSERMTYAGAFQVTLSSGAGRPVMIHELGASSAQYLPEVIAQYDRTSIYSALAAGSNGFLLWDVIDASPVAWRRAPYKTVPHETQFGLLTWEREPRPFGNAFREISQVISHMDLSGIEPEPASAALIVPFDWYKPEGDYSQMGMEDPAPGQYLAHHTENGVVQGLPPKDFSGDNLHFMRSQLSAFILLRQSGQKVALRREKQTWQDVPMLFLPSPLTSTESDITHVHTTFWHDVRDYVQRGGVVYASVCADAAIPEMADLFGARMVDHQPVETFTMKVVRAFGGLHPGDCFSFQGSGGAHRLWPATLKMLGGEVIAVDQNDRPVLTVHQYGQGFAVLCGAPIEAMLGNTPAVFENDQPAWRIYHAVAQKAGIFASVRSGHPKIEAGSLVGDKRGYTVLVNHSDKSQTITLDTSRSHSSLSLVTADGLKELNNSSINVPAWDGMVVSWKY